MVTDKHIKEYNQFKGALYLNTPNGAAAMWNRLEVLLKIEKEVA